MSQWLSDNWRGRNENRKIMERRNFLRMIAEVAGLLALPAPALARAPRSVLLQVSPVAGFQYHEGERLWPDLAESDALALVREPENPYDSRAVRVDWRGRKLGYVPRVENTAIAQMLDRGERLEVRSPRFDRPAIRGSG